MKGQADSVLACEKFLEPPAALAGDLLDLLQMTKLAELVGPGLPMHSTPAMNEAQVVEHLLRHTVSPYLVVQPFISGQYTIST